MIAKTGAQRQAKFKARLAAEGIKEVRGILAHEADHEAVREAARLHAAKLAKRRERKEKA
jgi:hypothetical protein